MQPLFDHHRQIKELDDFYPPVSHTQTHAENFSDSFKNDIAFFTKTAFSHPEWAKQMEDEFKRSFLPMIASEFSDLLSHANHRSLLEKLKMVTSRVYVFHMLTGNMRAAKVDPVLNIFGSAAYVIYDTFFDLPRYFDLNDPAAINRLRKIVQGEGENIASPKNCLESLFQKMMKVIATRMPECNRASFSDVFTRLHEMQIESAQFRSHDIPVEKIRINTYLRGGYSSQLSALLSDKPFSDQELRDFLILGAPIQLADDLGDLNEDRKEGLVTLAGLGVSKPEMVWKMTGLALEELNRHASGYGYGNDDFRIFRGMVGFYVEKNIRLYLEQSG